MSVTAEAVRQLGMVNEAKVWAKLVPREGDGRSRLLAALNELFPHEEWFERAAVTYGWIIDEYDEWKSKGQTGN